MSATLFVSPSAPSRGPHVFKIIDFLILILIDTFLTLYCNCIRDNREEMEKLFGVNEGDSHHSKEDTNKSVIP